MQEQVEASYRRQRESGLEMGLPSRFTAPDSVDNWRHTRMLATVRPLVQAAPAARWLTVGDGAYGSDAAYLRSLGADVTASSLVTETLSTAAERGFIGAYRAENAECITLGDDEVEFVLCKEAYHHFPRPPIALYEMLRVARLGVVLIEPIDGRLLLNGFKQAVKWALRGDTESRFEPSGNFIYRIDLDETAKLMTAAGELLMAYRRFNDFYFPGLGCDRASGWTRGHVLTRLCIGVQDVLCQAKLLAWGLATIVLFKGKPESNLLAALTRTGYVVRALPVNPFAGSPEP